MAKAIPDCPKDPEENAAFRDLINRRAEKYKDFAMACLYKSSVGADGRIWWSDTFSRTLDPRIRGSSSNIPLITFPKQERFIRFIHEKIKAGKPWGSRKSRGFGLTWAVVVEFDGLWIFEDDGAHLLVASREEAAVDSSKNPDSIMKKMDYHVLGLPDWQKEIVLPGYEPRQGTKFRNFKAAQNPVTGGTIIGESTKGNLARGGRKTAGVADEAAAIAFLMDVIASLSEVTDSMGYISTDLGLSTDFARLWMQKDKAIEFFENGCDWPSNPMWLGYWLDTLTNTPLNIKKDPDQHEQKLWIPGSTYNCKSGECPVHDHGEKPHSARYNSACKKLNYEKRKIAEEYDMEAAQAGGSVFDVVKCTNALESIREKIESGQTPWKHYRMELIHPVPAPAIYNEMKLYQERGKWPLRCVRVDGGPLRIFQHPFSCRDKNCLCKGTGEHVYVIGCDTSSGYATSDGAGAMVWDATVGEFVAELYGNFTATELGCQVAMLARYYGTESGDDRNAWCAIESAGEGATVNRIVSQHGVHVQLSQIKRTKESRRGVVVSRANRNAMLADNLEALINGDPDAKYPSFYCPFPEFWEQCLTFIEAAPTKTGVQKPDVTKKAAQYKSKDDRVFMGNHAIYGCRRRYGAARGVLIDKALRMGPVSYRVYDDRAA